MNESVKLRARHQPLAGRNPVSLTDLEQQQANLAAVQLDDFRSANLFDLVADQIPAGSRVLDVGCGAGGLVGYLLERHVDIWGVDTSEATVRAARGFLEGRGLDAQRIRVGSTQDLIADGELADVVVCMDCLEHVEDDGTLFNELVDLVKPGGTLVVTVPALMALYGERDERIGHFRRYERHELASLAATAPIDVHQLRFWNVLGVGPTFLTQKLLKRNVDESFRYGNPTLRKRVMRSMLHLWFRHVENRLHPPLGLTLFMVATRR
ncbi:MAG: class I SAM-dependent methyltransferase [Myxococcota bacterium]|nr:class I SAM-dependent methyltransferase [Myxococcota bacterium]